MIKRFTAAALAVAFLCACGWGQAAHATAVGRVDWVNLSGGAQGRDGVAVSYGGQDLTIGSSAVQTSAAPSFSPSLSGWARVQVYAGAAVCLAGANPTATTTNGSLVQAGGEAVYLPVQAGQLVGCIEAAKPSPVDDAPYTGSIALTVGVAAAAGRVILINASVAGNVSLLLADGSTLVVPVNAGLTLLPFKVTQVNSGGTTATATYTNLN